jgi:[ribosomal protein S5]-alanine N-acetyltransferase
MREDGGMEPSSSPVRLVVLDADTLQALVAGDAGRASAASGLDIPPWFTENRWLWTLRLGQLIGAPEQAPWLVRAVVRAEDGAVLGHAGYHGPPDARGMIEIGYEIAPEHRRRGYARAAVRQLLEDAGRNGAYVARASVSPDNAASLALIASCGFVRVGEQMDEIDGLELVFERGV